MLYRAFIFLYNTFKNIGKERENISIAKCLYFGTLKKVLFLIISTNSKILFPLNVHYCSITCQPVSFVFNYKKYMLVPEICFANEIK